MKGRFALSFPYLYALLIICLLAWGRSRSSVTDARPDDYPQEALCPVCMMQVEVTETALQGQRDGKKYYFCSEHCRGEFLSSEQTRSGQSGAHLDLVCNMEVGQEIALRLDGGTYYFCTTICRDRFAENSARYLMLSCPVCRADNQFRQALASCKTTWQGREYHFCTTEHREAFRSDPAGYFLHTMWGIPAWLYYSSIAMVLLLSFGVIERTENKSGSKNTRITSESPRIDLLSIRWLGSMMKWPGTRLVAQSIAVIFFVLVIAAGLFGNQLPGKNIAPLLTWTVWWGGLILLVAYAGKAWCYVCPWDAISDWAVGLRLWGKKKENLSLDLKWPRWMRNIWPATTLFVLLTWVELGFGVTMNPRATAWLGLAMLVLAFTSIFIFDRKSFCRYGCLVGRISGLYALFSPVEIRARERDVCRGCSTRSCYHGNAAGEGCPTFEYPGRMSQNTYCTMCMECVKTCEPENIALNIRPWGADLANHHLARRDEAYLALIMLSLTIFHGLTMTPSWSVIVEGISSSLAVGETLAFSIGMGAVMVAPAAVYAALVWLSKLVSGPSNVRYHDYFIRYAYALLPIALFYHLAHNMEHLLMEGQKIIPLLSDPLGRGWNLLGTKDITLAPLTNLSTLWIIQVILVMTGHVFSLWSARRTAGALFDDAGTARRSQVPMLVAMILFSLLSLWLLKQPMQMRSSMM
jgi:YHS domain-containing protein/polyferredoxin